MASHPWAAQCRKEIESAEDWSVDPSATAAPGEAGGFRVVGATSGRRGYLKPTKQGTPDEPRAANEKIVADLAFELQLPAVPVVLYRRKAYPPTEEPLACVSLLAFPEFWEWSQVMNLTGPVEAMVRGALARSSGVVALDTLTGNTDRNNGRNGIVGIDPTAPTKAGFMYIDHANSLNLGNRWDKGQWITVDLPAMPDMLRNAIHPPVLFSAIDRVESLSDSAIEVIVNRIPDDYLVPAQKKIIIEGLKGRRSLIRRAITSGLGL